MQCIFGYLRYGEMITSFFEDTYEYRNASFSTFWNEQAFDGQH